MDAGNVVAGRRLVLASGNRGKLLELQALVHSMGARVQAQSELGIEPAEEPHGTFLENAIAKARHAAIASSWPVLADDSGLCCRALGGGPGVRSARFAGPDASDAQNNAALLRALAGQSDRNAHYCCVVVAMRHADDPEPLVADGHWEGQIVDAPAGESGFGYDPHFWLPDLGCTVAQLAAEQKNRISHRAIAMRSIVALMRERWAW